MSYPSKSKNPTCCFCEKDLTVNETYFNGDICKKCDSDHTKDIVRFNSLKIGDLFRFIHSRILFRVTQINHLIHYKQVNGFMPGSKSLNCEMYVDKLSKKP